MAQERHSIKFVQEQQKAADTFDYFVCGVAGAIFAFIIKDYTPQRMQFDWSLLTLLSLILLAMTFFVGLKRIECTLLCRRFDALKLDAEEKAKDYATLLLEPFVQHSVHGKLMSHNDVQYLHSREVERLSEMRNKASEMSQKSGTLYNARNQLLLLGFATILAAKIAQPYAHGVSSLNTNSATISTPTNLLSSSMSQLKATNTTLLQSPVPQKSNTAVKP